jgi:hypothetical protein
MSIYYDWGFTGNPFEQTPLRADETGNSLLIGREKELKRLISLIETGPRLPTVEGLNGVGKTSLVNVAAFRLMKASFEEPGRALYIPCRRVFQLSANGDLGEFIDSIYLEIAQTIIDFQDILLNRWDNTNVVKPIARWLNSPKFSAVQGGLSVFGFGPQFGVSSQPNTSEGFHRSGFRKNVKDWLSEMYPQTAPGGIVCIIDNLELLQVAETTRKILEQLRDDLFTTAGVRFVLCGSNGIIHSVVSSPRLSGILHRPIDLSGLDTSDADSVLSSRVNVFSKSKGESYLPILPNDFLDLYQILNSNLRSVLQQADEYCISVHDGEHPVSDDEKQAKYHSWLIDEGKALHDAVDRQLTPRSWKVLEDGVKLGGSFSPSAYELFGFNSLEAFRPSVKALEDVHLVTSVRDESDKRRKSIVITPKAFLISHYRELLKPKDQPENRR